MNKTPVDKWKDTIQQYRIQCQKITKISKNIRYAGVINQYGRTLTGIISPGVKPILKSEQVKNEFFIVSTLMSLRKEPAGAIGKLDHVILKHDKVTIAAIPYDKITFYVSISIEQQNVHNIIQKIKKILGND